MTTADALFARYRGKRVLLDANLLLLYLVGTFDRNRISLFKRTSDFTAEEFDLLSVLLTQFQTIVTTPHVLTEVSSLANSLPSQLKPLWWDHFAYQTGTLLEIFQAATTVMQESCFNPFGLTDAAVQNAAFDTLVLTEDFRLSGYLESQGIATLNFRDIVLSL